jgi:hypothetical protein
MVRRRTRSAPGKGRHLETVTYTPQKEDTTGQSRRNHGFDGYRPQLTPRNLIKMLAKGQSSTDLNITKRRRVFWFSDTVAQQEPPGRGSRVQALGHYLSRNVPQRIRPQESDRASTGTIPVAHRLRARPPEPPFQVSTPTAGKPKRALKLREANLSQWVTDSGGTSRRLGITNYAVSNENEAPKHRLQAHH